MLYLISTNNYSFITNLSIRTNTTSVDNHWYNQHIVIWNSTGCWLIDN